MQRLLILALLCGCEQIEPSGNPLQPAQVTAAQPTAVPVHVVDGAVAVDEPEEEEAFTLSSEELAPGSEVSPEDSPQEDVSPAAAPDPQAAAPAEAATPIPPPTLGWPQQMGTAWPVRLVTTVPNASPPRAILGLPDGKEIVVNPGSMVPELGLVVVAISPGAAELAKIAPAGDHATIESVTLRAQY
jgi:hypothetical protein